MNKSKFSITEINEITDSYNDAYNDLNIKIPMLFKETIEEVYKEYDIIEKLITPVLSNNFSYASLLFNGEESMNNIIDNDYLKLIELTEIEYNLDLNLLQKVCLKNSYKEKGMNFI